MKAVIDASVAVKWVIEEPDTPLAHRLELSDMMAPNFLFLECANVIWKGIHRAEITLQQGSAKLATLMAMPLTIIPTVELLSRALEYGGMLNHPVYDCVYLAAAERHGCKVITVDHRLLRAAKSDARTAELVVSLSDAAAN